MEAQHPLTAKPGSQLAVGANAIAGILRPTPVATGLRMVCADCKRGDPENKISPKITKIVSVEQGWTHLWEIHGRINPAKLPELVLRYLEPADDA